MALQQRCRDATTHRQPPSFTIPARDLAQLTNLPLASVSTSLLVGPPPAPVRLRTCLLQAAAAKKPRERGGWGAQLTDNCGVAPAKRHVA